MTRTRRISRTVSVALVVLMAPAWGAADERPPPDDSGQLKRQVVVLIRDLGSEIRSIRTEARRALLGLGPSILPLLPAPEELPSASVREAIREIRIDLEKRQARASIKPSHVNIPETMTLQGFLAAVRAQTGNDVDASGLPAELLKQEVKLDAGEQTFWAAMDQVARKLGLVYAGGSTARSLKLEPRRDDARNRPPLVVYDGVSRVAVAPAQLRPIFGDDAHRLLRVEIEILVEPRLRPLFLQYASSDVTASGADGRKFESFSPNASYELPMGNGRSSVVARAEFRVPSKTQLKHVNLHGNLKLQTAAGSATFRFSDLKDSQGKARRRGGVVTTLRKVDFQPANGGEFAANIGIAVAYETGGPAFESHRTWIFHNETYLEAKDGRHIEPQADFKTLLQADGVVAIEYRFERLTGDSGGYSFVYVAPTLIINVPVKFEVRQIPVLPPNQEGTRP